MECLAGFGWAPQAKIRSWRSASPVNQNFMFKVTRSSHAPSLGMVHWLTYVKTGLEHQGNLKKGALGVLSDTDLIPTYTTDTTLGQI